MNNSKNNLPTKSSKADIDNFLQKVAATPVNKNQGKGRLIFSMDATASRKPTWDAACNIQGQMFEQTSSLGGLSVLLSYYRGYNEFHTSSWNSNPADLLHSMLGVECIGGLTQIKKVLEHALYETKIKKVNAVVFVGDAMEENIDHLCNLAGELGLLGVPVFIFQENHDPIATMAFEQIAKLSHGAYCLFDASSAEQLKDLLNAVAVFAAGGYNALESFSQRAGGAALKLSNQINPVHLNKK